MTFLDKGESRGTGYWVSEVRMGNEQVFEEERNTRAHAHTQEVLAR